VIVSYEGPSYGLEGICNGPCYGFCEVLATGEMWNSEMVLAMAPVRVADNARMWEYTKAFVLLLETVRAIHPK